jgi:hypothetical protein
MPPFLTADELSSLPPCEREYLSIDGKLNRLTLYFGALRRCEVSVVRLPSSDRIEGNEPLATYAIGPNNDARFVLIPDAALAHAGLVGEALTQSGTGTVHPLPLGNKTVFLARDRSKSAFFKSFRIIASGPKRAIEHALFRCGALILHGRMDEAEQRKFQQELRGFCRGRERMHLFLGDKWYLTES